MANDYLSVKDQQLLAQTFVAKYDEAEEDRRRLLETLQ